MKSRGLNGYSGIQGFHKGFCQFFVGSCRDVSGFSLQAFPARSSCLWGGVLEGVHMHNNLLIGLCLTLESFQGC